jgi:RNA polymerase sigma-70 factor (ECF subfamily)
VPEIDSLAVRFRGGDEGAFDEIVRATERPVLRVAFLYLGDEASALDAAQETFTEAYHALRGWTGERGLRTWLFRTALNKAREIARARRGPDLEGLMREGPPVSALPADPVDVAERRAIVRGCLAELPAREHEVVILRHYEGLRFREIAETLGIAEGTARATFHQALASLREKLSRRLG